LLNSRIGDPKQSLFIALSLGSGKRGPRRPDGQNRCQGSHQGHRRNRPAAEELADETLNRVARTLAQTGAIATKPPARYCYVVAKFVLLEDVRRERRHVPLDETWHVDGARPTPRIVPDSGVMLKEQRLDCLDRCLQELKPEQRDLIVEYYADDRRQKIERRRDLATRLGITMNALGIRAFRIRDGLMACVESCRQRRRQI
jgi:DNA-directed RNA polymerase specialized sigma24 family protein